MHIPDGVLSNRVWVAFDALSGASILFAARRVSVEASARIVPIMGVLSAFIFAAQLLNFPIFGGTSGHLVGGALLAALLGPVAGFITMATVIVAQALFGDGGIAALGANLFNIGTVTTVTGYLIYRLVAAGRPAPARLAVAGFLAGWGSVVLSAACCALMLGLSGTVPVRAGLPAMAGYHAVIGLVEGGLTAAVLVFLARVRPELLAQRPEARLGLSGWVFALALVAVPCAILALAGSSGLPDPLERLLGSTTGQLP